MLQWLHIILSIANIADFLRFQLFYLLYFLLNFRHFLGTTVEIIPGEPLLKIVDNFCILSGDRCQLELLSVKFKYGIDIFQVDLLLLCAIHINDYCTICPIL